MKSIVGLKTLAKRTNIIGELKFYSIQKRAIRFSKNLIALYFYNNSNNVAILLPRKALTLEKSGVHWAFLTSEIIPTQVLSFDLGV